MSTKRKQATGAPSWQARQAEAEKRAKQEFLGDVIKEWTKQKSSAPNGRLPRGGLHKIFSKFGPPEWLTKNAFFNEVARREKTVHQQPTAVATVAPPVESIAFLPSGNNSISMSTLTMEEEAHQNELSDSVTQERGPGRANKGGRPKGSKNESTQQLRRCINEALTEATMMFNKECNDAKEKGEQIPRGKLDSIIKAAGRSNGLTSPETIQYIKPSTVRTRSSRGNLFGLQTSNLSPMRHIEDVLVQFCVMLNRMAVTIDSQTFLDLANDIIKGTPVEEELKMWKEKRKITTDALGFGYYSRFMSRHKHIISSVHITAKDNNRTTWATYDNIEKMYNLIYPLLVEAGIAVKLDQPVWKDRMGHIVPDETEAFGCQVEYELTDPSYFLFVDETGTNTNMKKDGKQGGKRGIAEKGFSAEMDACISDNHWTVLPFTAATGEPVMCAIIMKSDGGLIPTNWKTGVDVAKLGGTFATQTDEEFLRNQTADGCLSGGPTCHYRGVDVPCFVCCSPHGGITSELLVEMLKVMDGLNLFPRVNGKRPMLLLDGHQSRLQLPFLQYIRDNDWCVCIGVPYGTHWWQVGDSSEQNGSYKVCQKKVKFEVLEKKKELNLPLTLGPTDIVPIVKKSWDSSFGRVEHNKKAINDRGWLLCNKALLIHPEVMRTKTNALGSHVFGANDARMTTQSLQLNTETGKAADLFEKIYQKSINSASAIRARQERAGTAERARKVLDRTKCLTSGKLFGNDMAGLHKEGILEHQLAVRAEKVAKLNSAADKRSAKRRAKRAKVKAILEKKEDPSTLSVSELKILLSYKKRAADGPISSLGNNKETLMALWHEYKARATPPTSENEEEAGVVDT